jgi:hypothetical protein
MVTTEQAREYLRVVGTLVPPDVDDRDWLLVAAGLYAGGFIKEIDWDTRQGGVLIDLIGRVYPDFQKWVRDEDVDLADFR